MKKIFIILILAMLIPTIGFSLNMSAGIKGGVSLNHMWGDDWDAYFDSNPTWEKKFRLGFSVGGFVSLDIMKNIAIQPEIYFSMIGGGFEDTASGSEADYKHQILVKCYSLQQSV